MVGRMTLLPYEHANLRLRYRQYLELATMVTLSLFVVALYTMPKFESFELENNTYIAPIESYEIPPETQQFEKPPPPMRPSIPIESEPDQIDPELTIEFTTLAEFVPFDAPKPAPPNDIPFVEWDEDPEPIGGYGALGKNVIYPEIAREAGIQGIVIVKTLIGKDGTVRATEIFKGIPKTGLDEAAMNAVKMTAWKPAYQRDKPVPVWVNIPIIFRLSSN